MDPLPLFCSHCTRKLSSDYAMGIHLQTMNAVDVIGIDTEQFYAGMYAHKADIDKF